MANPNERQDKVSATLARELDILPGEIHNMEEFLKKLDGLIKNYADKYSMYMTKDMQKELAIMHNESDVLLLDISRMKYRIVEYAITTDKGFLLETNVDLSVVSETNKKEIAEFKKDFQKTRNNLLALENKLKKFIEHMVKKDLV